MEVITSSDVNYLPGAIALCRSLKRQGYRLNVMVPPRPKKKPTNTPQMKQVWKTLYEEGCNVIEGPFIPQHWPQLAWINHCMYYKIYSAALLKEADRILYLDADTVCVGDISDLADLDLEGCPTGAVVDFGASTLDKMAKGLVLDSSLPAFNSGVLLIDANKWRDGHIIDATATVIGTHKKSLKWPDQSALNLVHKGNFFQLPPKYNWSAKAGNPPEDVRIMHWHGKNKPWNTQSVPSYDMWKQFQEDDGSD